MLCEVMCIKRCFHRCQHRLEAIEPIIKKPLMAGKRIIDRTRGPSHFFGGRCNPTCGGLNLIGTEQRHVLAHVSSPTVSGFAVSAATTCALASSTAMTSPVNIADNGIAMGIARSKQTARLWPIPQV